MQMPCAHSSWWPARQAGQTTGSMVSRLEPRDSAHWLTGTSSPCLSVFKPVRLGDSGAFTGPTGGACFDEASLFWRHERLHRITLENYDALQKEFEAERRAMQDRFLAGGCAIQPCWDEHLAALPEWTDRIIRRQAKRKIISRFSAYWNRQNRLDGVPAR